MQSHFENPQSNYKIHNRIIKIHNRTRVRTRNTFGLQSHYTNPQSHYVIHNRTNKIHNRTRVRTRNTPITQYLLSCRWTFLSESLEPQKVKIGQLLTSRLATGHQKEPQTSMISHCQELPINSLQEQICFLCNIPNYHWWEYQVLPGEKRSKNTCVRSSQHLLFHPDQEFSDVTKAITSKHPPTSPRNQLMLFCLNSSDRFHSTLRHLLSYDQKGDEASIVEIPGSADDDFEADGAPPAKREKRWKATRVVSVSPLTLCERMNLQYDEVVKNSSCDKTLFTSFFRALAGSNGTILWRQHSSDRDVVVLNNYSDSTGLLLPQDFVHLTATHAGDGSVFTQCTCKIYQWLHTIALQGVELEEGENAVLGANSTCMHCRFFLTYLLGSLEGHQPEGDNTNHLLAKITPTLQQMSNPIVVLGVSTPRVSKFSVVGDQEDFSVISMTLNADGSRSARCNHGLCRARLSNKKRVPKKVSLDKMSKICPHLHTFFANFEVVKEFIPQPDGQAGSEQGPCEGEEDEEEEEEVEEEEGRGGAGPQPEENVEDAGILGSILGSIPAANQNANIFFTSGMWQSHCFSTHKPREERDPHLIKCRRVRLTIPDFDNMKDGYYTGPDLIPSPFTPDGEPRPCQCGVSVFRLSACNRTTTIHNRIT